MSNSFDLSAYETVDVRLKRFLDLNKDARVFTNIEKLEGDLVVIKAWIYRNADEQAKGLFLATGYAYEEKGSGFVNKTSYIENCETSAIGRALANLGMNGALRPSREEMEKADRMGKAPQTPVTAPNPQVTPPQPNTSPNTQKPSEQPKAAFSHTPRPPAPTGNAIKDADVEIVQFGKDKGKVWADLAVDRLEWYCAYFAGKVKDGGKFKESNQKILSHIEGLLAKELGV